MCISMNKIAVGNHVVAMVAGREIPAEVVNVGAMECHVRSLATGKEFTTNRIERIMTKTDHEAIRPFISVEPTTPPAEPVNSDDAPNPAPEQASNEPRTKRMSLLDAAVEVLKTTGRPMNAREIITVAREQGLWNTASGKTPEQTLYGSIFREITSGTNPRFARSSERGKFQLTSQ